MKKIICGITILLLASSISAEPITYKALNTAAVNSDLMILGVIEHSVVKEYYGDRITWDLHPNPVIATKSSTQQFQFLRRGWIVMA